MKFARNVVLVPKWRFVKNFKEEVAPERLHPFAKEPNAKDYSASYADSQSTESRILAT